MTYYALLFIAGFAGSFHCIGMCGGFACALGPDRARRRRHIAPSSAIQHGQVVGLLFPRRPGRRAGRGDLHALAPGPQRAAPLLSASLDLGQRALAVTAGLLMIFMALSFFGLRRLAPGPERIRGSTLVASLRSLLGRRGFAAPLAFGVLNGFLPCPLVYAMIAQAASTFDVLSGCLTMAAFGLGTFPAMLAMGGIGRLLAPSWRQRGVRLAGSFILVLGLVTLSRGIMPMMVGHGLHHLWHFA